MVFLCLRMMEMRSYWIRIETKYKGWLTYRKNRVHRRKRTYTEQIGHTEREGDTHRGKRTHTEGRGHTQREKDITEEGDIHRENRTYTERCMLK